MLLIPSNPCRDTVVTTNTAAMYAPPLRRNCLNRTWGEVMFTLHVVDERRQGRNRKPSHAKLPYDPSWSKKIECPLWNATFRKKIRFVGHANLSEISEISIYKRDATLEAVGDRISVHILLNGRNLGATLLHDETFETCGSSGHEPFVM